MKILKVIIASILLTAIFCSILPVSAIGNIGDCYVYFSIKNNTNNEFVDKITVKMSNPALSLNYSFEISYLDYMIGYRPVVGVVKTGEYTIQLEYFSVDEYVIKNADGTAISSLFVAKEGEHTFEWSIEPIVPQTSILPNDKETNDKTNDKTNNINFVVNQEADELFQKYIKAVAPLIDDNQNVQLWIKIGNNNFENDVKSMDKKGRLVKIGRTKNEMLSLSKFERVLSRTTLIMPYSFAEFYDDWEGLDFWNENIIGNSLSLHEGFSEEAYECFYDLMKWNYYYYETHGVPFDFLKNAELLHGDPDGNIADAAIQRMYGENESKEDGDEDKPEKSKDDVSSRGDAESVSVYVSDEIFDASVSTLDVDIDSESNEDDELWGESIKIFMRGVVFTLILLIIAAVVMLIITKRRINK